MSYALSKPREIPVVDDPDSADSQALLNVVRNGYHPFQVVALGSPLGQRPGRDDMSHSFRIVTR